MSYRNYEILYPLGMNHHDAQLLICRQGHKGSKSYILLVRFFCEEIDRPIKSSNFDARLSMDSFKTLFKFRDYIRPQVWNDLMGFMSEGEQDEFKNFVNGLDLGYRTVYEVLPKYKYIKNSMALAEAELKASTPPKKEEPKDDYEF